MNIFNHLLLTALAGFPPALVAAAPNYYLLGAALAGPQPTSASGPHPTGTDASIAAAPTGKVAKASGSSGLIATGTGCVASTGTALSACLATEAPIYANTTYTTISSTLTSSTLAPLPTGTWNDGYGDLQATSFSVLILPSTKQVEIQTYAVNGNSVPFTQLTCPNSGGDFENPQGSKDILPWYLLIHGGNVCKGTLQIGADFDDTWLKYSNLEQINVPTSSRCSSVGSAMRCVLPLDPTRSS